MTADAPAGRRTVKVPTATPPGWVNALVKGLLRTPGLQSWLGRRLALITWTGRRSGRRYTTPVSYSRSDGRVIVLTKRFRPWWHNFAEQPDVELRLAGRTVQGRARAHVDDEAYLPLLTEYLEHNTADAKAYGVSLDGDGRLDERDARALLPQVVIVEIALES